MKRCSRCGETKPLDQYIKSGKSKDGLEYWCNGCRKTERDAWRARNIEAIRAWDKVRPWNKAPAVSEKLCPSCQQTLPLTSFHKRRNGVQPRCKTCRRNDEALVKRRRYESMPLAKERLFMAALRRYGLTKVDYDRMVADQGNRCAICDEPPKDNAPGKRLHIDHDHDTGAVRALLCHGCNTGLGLFDEDPAIVEAAAAYLRRHKSIKAA